MVQIQWEYESIIIEENFDKKKSIQYKKLTQGVDIYNHCCLFSYCIGHPVENTKETHHLI